MPFIVTMPKLSPTMEDGTILSWHAQEGSLVKTGDLLMEVSTDKASVEYAALDEGYLRKILVSSGGVAQVNDPIAVFTETLEESIEGFSSPAQGAAVKETSQEKEPELASDSFSEKKEGPQEKSFQKSFQEPLFEPEPPLQGYQWPGEEADPFTLRASPLARKIAQEKGLDLSSVTGSGPGGRVVSEDLQFAQAEGVVSFSKRRPQKIPGSFQEKAMTPVQKVVAKRLQESSTFIPHFSVTHEFCMDSLSKIRAELGAFGLKLSFNDLIVKATALALQQHPEINSAFHTANQSVIQFQTIDVSIAVGIDNGLITPIVRHANFLNVSTISSTIRKLVDKAHKGTLKREEYMGGSFTISNLGMFGIKSFSAIINPPQGGILSVGGIREKVVWRNNQPVPMPYCDMTLTADHRIVNGVDAAKFLQSLDKLISNASVLLL